MSPARPRWAARSCSHWRWLRWPALHHFTLASLTATAEFCEILRRFVERDAALSA